MYANNAYIHIEMRKTSKLCIWFEDTKQFERIIWYCTDELHIESDPIWFHFSMVQIQNEEDGDRGANGHRVRQHVPEVQKIDIAYVIHRRHDMVQCFAR